MPSFKIDTDVFKEALSGAIVQDLGLVTLTPGLLALEDVDPDSLPSTPAIMVSSSLVPSVRYRFGYIRHRYLVLGYILERDGSYEVGEFEILNDLPSFEPESGQTFSPPALYTKKRATMLQGDPIGVELGTEYDPAIGDADVYPAFGITYKTITAAPSVFPTLRMFRRTVLGKESV